MPDPLVSIVVPTYNRAGFVGRTVDALRELDPPQGGYEVVVVDDGSTDATAEVLAALEPPFRLVRRENGGPAAARNTGVAASHGAIVVFTDDDCAPDRDWLLRLLEGLDDESVAAVGGRTVPASDEDVVSRFMARRQISELPPRSAEGEVLWVVTCNAAVRRSVLEEVGGFDERYAQPGGEDTDLSTRMRARGHRLAVAGDAVVRHDHTWRSVGHFANTWFRYGLGDARHLERDGEKLRPGALVLGSLRYTKTVGRNLVADLRGDVGLADSIAFAGLDLLRRWSQTSGVFVGFRRAG